MSLATLMMRSHGQYAKQCMQVGLSHARNKAVVFDTVLKVDPMAAELISRLQAMLPAIAAQVLAASQGEPSRSAAPLLEPSQNIMHTAAKHNFLLPFD
jgi:hypothetical protein